VSSVLERLGAATAREKAVGTRVLLVGLVACVVILGGWLIYAFSHPESVTCTQWTSASTATAASSSGT